MKNDNLFYHPDDYDFLVQVASLFLKKGIRNRRLPLIKNPYLYRWETYIYFSSFEYMDLKSFGIFSVLPLTSFVYGRWCYLILY